MSDEHGLEYIDFAMGMFDAAEVEIETRPSGVLRAVNPTESRKDGEIDKQEEFTAFVSCITPPISR